MWLMLCYQVFKGSLIALLQGASRERACVATQSCGVALLTVYA